MGKKVKKMNRFTCSISPRKYVHLYKEKISKAFVYVLILATFIGVIEGVMGAMAISYIEKESTVLLKEDDLRFEMKDGILDFKASPLKQEDGQILLYIDTNKNIDEVDSLRSITVHKEVATVLLKDGFMFKTGSKKITLKYSEIPIGKFNFDNDLVISALDKVDILKYLIIPFIIIFRFIELLMYALAISLVAILSNLISNRKMKYVEVLNLSLYSITGPAIVSMIYPLGRFSVIVGGTVLIFALAFIDYDNKKQGIQENQ